MKLNMVLVALCVTLVGGIWLAWTPATHANEGDGGIQVSATAYTCDVHPRNPMSGCSRLRWGGNVNNPGMACPVEWRNREFVVGDFGVLRCDDTGRYDIWNGLPHIDIRMSTWEQTRAWGVRTITIYPAEQQTVAVAPTDHQAPEGALSLAKARVPKGDASTALVRRTRFDTAVNTMPWLAEVVQTSGDQPIWLVTLWQPRDLLPADATGLPNRNDPIATTLVILDANSGTVLGETHITMEALNAVGAIQNDQ
jgi:hypothetical protein